MTVPFLTYFIASTANQRSDNMLTCAQCDPLFRKKKKNYTDVFLETAKTAKTADLHIRQEGSLFYELFWT